LFPLHFAPRSTDHLEVLFIGASLRRHLSAPGRSVDRGSTAIPESGSSAPDEYARRTVVSVVETLPARWPAERSWRQDERVHAPEELELRFRRQ